LVGPDVLVCAGVFVAGATVFVAPLVAVAVEAGRVARGRPRRLGRVVVSAGGDDESEGEERSNDTHAHRADMECLPR
jgi:hypothetical protein